MRNRLTPIKRRELVQRLRELGFEGPFASGKHQFMVRGRVKLILPNPHQTDIGVDFFAVSSIRQASAVKSGWARTEQGS